MAVVAQFPAFRLHRDRPGKMTSALLSLYQDRIRPDFVRLIIQDTPDPDDSHQFVMELARLQALVRDPQPPD